LISAIKEQIVIIKLDDLMVSTLSAFQKVNDIIIEKDIKAGFGIIANSLESNGSNQAYYDAIKRLANNSRVEIWNHGYTHALNGTTSGEFFNTPYDQQYENFKKAMELVASKCGVEMRSFGSPGNRADSSFIKVIRQFPQIKVFMFPSLIDTNSNQLLLSNRVDMESTTGMLEYDFFVKKYNRNESLPYMVLQGHPGMWDEARFEDFIKIIDFIKMRGCTFMTPNEYYSYSQSIAAQKSDINMRF
jgi:peptidoglycan/xylan/chitin deacetylase (PgdA/CDA1 family)